MAGTYAVVWSTGAGRTAGRLELGSDRLELSGPDRRLSVPLSEVSSVGIGRDRDERLLGLPVVVLERKAGATVRIAALGGAGRLHEIVTQIEQARRLLEGYPAESGT
jgi:hypothetical protein